MTYQPSNRTGKPPLGERYDARDGLQFASEWFVDDIDCKDNPIAYGSPDTSLRVMPDRGSWIVCTDRGMFLKHPPRRREGKGRTMKFKSLEAAILHAEGHAGLEPSTNAPRP